ncbi:MAG: hypothetical protein A2586_01925 [Candidatus Harrisonbacteria bacterium RIFOXYD1_FULL_40_9]|uniref:Uncharacterized protein n=1 Tax=Candidatus Harrisonbacteria bacterium RIFOXYD1_FULL_40_9 TaxID=1798412 RepID=A0A1G1ZWX9_9BACT|nr:MAG: hypothetical protein A2586_01925 [Candidatus Harrisonbacteria bacterium RIFOXYD1_FULL_40_9]
MSFRNLGLRKISIILATLLFIVGLITWSYISKREEKMIKLDACIASCGGGFRLDDRADEYYSCRNKCREKYAVTWEVYNQWKK